jgi:MFS family permease
VRPRPIPGGLRAYAGLLTDRDFRRLWIAQSISQLGTQVTNLALPLVAIVVLGASAFEVAVLGAVEFLPFLLFTLPAGVWVDRLEKRRLMVAADLGRAVILGSVPVAALEGWLSIWLLYVVAFAAGTLTVVFDISYQAIVPELVARDRLQEANSRLEISRSAALVLGPGLGGFLVGVMSAPTAIVVDALSYLGSAGFLFGLRRRHAPHAGDAQGGAARPAAAAPRASLRTEMAEGLRFFAANALLRASSGSIVIQNVASQVSGAILLVFAVRELSLTAETIGLAISLGSVGVLAGAATASAVGRRIGVGPTLTVAALANAVATAFLVASTPSTAFVLFVAWGAVAGYAGMLTNVNGLSLRQAVTPTALQGRVNATGRWINWSVIPVGSIVGGALAGIIGLRATVGVGAVLAFLAVPWLVLSPLRTLRSMPALEPSPRPDREPDPMASFAPANDDLSGPTGSVLHTPD